MTVGDRIAGTLLGLAAGDALGARYEFTQPGPAAGIAMVGGGAGMPSHDNDLVHGLARQEPVPSSP